MMAPLARGWRSAVSVSMSCARFFWCAPPLISTSRQGSDKGARGRQLVSLSRSNNYHTQFEILHCVLRVFLTETILLSRSRGAFSSLLGVFRFTSAAPYQASHKPRENLRHYRLSLTLPLRRALRSDTSPIPPCAASSTFLLVVRLPD